MNSIVVCVRIASRNVVGVLSPVLFDIKVNNTRCVVGPKDYIVLWKVVGRIKEVERCSNAIEEPKLLRAFCTIQHPSTVGIWIAPV